MKHEQFMKIALEQAYRGIRWGNGGPFGACIVKDGRVLARGHNQVLKTKDPTRHAEICVIGAAARRLGSPHLRGCVLYSTTEPCPMCFSAIHWAQIKKVYFGTSIEDVQKLGFNELPISNHTMKRLGKSPVQVSNGILSRECYDLLKAWKKLPGKKTY